MTASTQIGDRDLEPTEKPRTRLGRHSQSSRASPDTRPNSAVLWVTTIKLFAKAVAAIIKSLGPIIKPWAAKPARNLPYSSAAGSSNARDSNYCLNLSTRLAL
jgi:hypothetical protein